MCVSYRCIVVLRMGVMERGASQYIYGIMDMDRKTKLSFFFPLVDCVGCLGS
jgi:hypothetical protein